MKLNLNKQFVNGIELTQSNRNYIGKRARRFTLYDSIHCIWIPCTYLEEDGTIKVGLDVIQWIFDKPSNRNQIRLALKQGRTI